MNGPPRLSVIVPVYKVESYLAECLDSLLTQDFSDFEIIAVDDCSPDGSGAILKEFEERDERMRVLSLKENVGLGMARNAGLEMARGEYVWFLDSDDVVRPGTLAKVMARLDATKAEVVMFGWVRFYEDRTEKIGSGTEILLTAPETFTASECPKIMKVLQVAWNKLIRRELLERTGLRFPKGFYEDTAFTYPLLASARSITTVPVPVVGYRQRTSGAITATRSSRHLEVLGQWARAMSRMKELNSGSKELRAELFPLMIRHCTYILMDRRRLPSDRHREYMTELQSLFREHQPADGYETHSFGEKLELGIVRSGSLPLLKLFWAARRTWWMAAGHPGTKPVPMERRQVSRGAAQQRAAR